jgi:hypothetical protein
MKRPPAERRHLDTRTILDYLEGRLAARDQTRVETHLAGTCSRCRERFHEAARLLDTMRADRATAVPESMRSRALRLFEGRRVPVSPVSSTWRLARLVFDSLVEPLPAPVRRAVGEARWLRFDLDEERLEVEVEPESAEAVTIRGRLTAAEPALYRIEVESAGESLAVWPDADGGFALERVPRGAATVVLHGPGERWRLPGVEL